MTVIKISEGQGREGDWSERVGGEKQGRKHSLKQRYGNEKYNNNVRKKSKNIMQDSNIDEAEKMR